MRKNENSGKTTNFIDELDAIHAPDALVARTLKAMREENDRAGAAEGVEGAQSGAADGERAPLKAVGGGAGRRSAPKWRRWGGYLAAAACLAVAIGLGSRLFLPEAVEMGVLDAASLPETTLTQRGDAAEEDVEDFLAENGVALEALTPGYAMETARLESGANAQGERRRMATAVYAGEDGSLTVTVADFETILYQAMADMPATSLETGEVRFARDAEQGATYAAWQEGAVYLTAYTEELTPEAFVALVEEIQGR